jgi:hypothetical protein
MSMYALAEPFTPQFNAMVDASVTEAVARLEGREPRLRDVVTAAQREWSGHLAAFDTEAARIRAATTADYARIDAAHALEMARISLIGDFA